MKVLVYSYNASIKDCLAPDEMFININNVVSLEEEPRPLTGGKKFYRIYFVNRDMKNIDESDAKKIIERIK